MGEGNPGRAMKVPAGSSLRGDTQCTTEARSRFLRASEVAVIQS